MYNPDEDDFTDWGGSLKIEKPPKSNYKLIIIIGLVGLLLIIVGKIICKH